MSPYREPVQREPRPLPVLREEYEEARAALAEDAPGLLSAAFFWGLVTSASPLLLTSSPYCVAMVAFAVAVEVRVLFAIARHRRTIRLWRDQERRRIAEGDRPC